MASGLEYEEFKPNETIICQGNVGDTFYIITEGTVSVYRTDRQGREEKVGVLQRGSYFGERALLRDEARQASCVADTAVSCLTLGRRDFIAMIGSLEDLFNINSSQATGGEGGGGSTIPYPACSDEEVIMHDFIQRSVHSGTDSEAATLEELTVQPRSISDVVMIKILGRGAFGHVKLCCLHNRKMYFALKCQSKSIIQKQNMKERVLNEIEIMRQLDHPFIVKFYTAMQDNRYLYFAMELLQGICRLSLLRSVSLTL